MKLRIIVIVGACLAGLPSTAFATAETFMELEDFTDATGNVVPYEDDNSTQYTNTSNANQPLNVEGAASSGLWIINTGTTVIGSSQNAFAQSSGYASYGHLGGAAATNTWEVGQYEIDGRYFTNPYGASASAYAAVRWEDTVILGLPDAPAGTPMRATFGINLHDTWYTSDLRNCSSAVANVIFYANGQGMSVVGGACPSPANVAEETIEGYAGDSVQLVDLLQVYASSGVPDRTGSDNTGGGIDALDTSDFFLDILTPGGYYSSESGTVYPTEFPPESADGTPEPSSLVMLGCGLFGIIIGMHTRSRWWHPSSPIRLG